MQLIEVEVKTRNLKHKYWRYTNDSHRFFLLERLELKACILEQFLKMFPDKLSSVVFSLEKLDEHPQWSRITDDTCVFNKITICCLLDTLITDIFFGCPQKMLDKETEQLASRVIIKASRTIVAEDSETLKTVLSLEKVPNIDQLIKLNP